MRHTALSTLILAASLASSACLADASPTSPIAAVDNLGGDPAALTPPVTLDDELLALSRLIEGFGGAFLEDGTAVLLLLDPATQELPAVRAAAKFFESAASELVLLAGRPVAVRKATYSFQWLHFTRRAFDERWPKGTVSSDIDERNNRLLISVLPGEAATVAAQAVLDLLELPREAAAIVSVPETPRPGIDTLDGFVRPTVGGVKITRSYAGGSSTCTLGANVVKVGNPNAFFVTNSHCSTIMLGLDPSSTAWAQPAPFDYFATGEEADPPVFTGGGCPSGAVCRYSDATLVRYTDPLDWFGAHIAWVTNGPPWTFTYHLVIDQTITPFGTAVAKTGAVTGPTSGYLGQSCVTFAPDSAAWASAGVIIPGNLKLLCQNSATLTMDHGDSGAPVYSAGILGGVYLRGIAHSFSSGTLWYSPVAGIRSDLGNLRWDLY